jgi:hypothetical protein
MRLPTVAMSLLVLAACSEAERNDVSCIKRADHDFNLCLKEGANQCTPKRIQAVRICDKQWSIS